MNTGIEFRKAAPNKTGLIGKVATLIIAIAIVITFAACSAGASSFSIEGKWKNTGSGGFGQMQPGAIVTFNGNNCNVYSPNDTYAFYSENGKYKLDVTGLLGGTPSFTVTVIDNNHISMTTGLSDVVELTRVG
ncbi:MAG: hypothetical protein IJ087_06970 [Eggerthellaceae bacterium]|nr:hypothetical protein [Eggerthellaceae bacterium]